MSSDSHNLHGSAPDKSKTALLVIDVINDFDFDEADQLLKLANPMAENLSSLLSRARQARMPVVLKQKHSGFFATTLDTLLNYLEVESVILTGIATNICVLFTANDAYMRDLRLIVPADCVAANTQELTDYTLNQMKTVLKTDVVSGAKLTPVKLKELIG